MLKTLLTYAVSITCGAAVSVGLFILMFALSKPETYETSQEIKETLSVGASLAAIGFMGILSLRGVFKKNSNFFPYQIVVGVVMSVPAFFIGLTGLIFALEKVLGIGSRIDMPYLIAALIFGIVVSWLGFELFSRTFGFPIPLVFIYWTPVILFNPYLLDPLSEENKRNPGTLKIMSVVALMVGVVLGMGCFNFLGHEYATKQMLLKNGARVTGIVMQKTKGYDNEDTQVYIKYNFAAPDGKLITKSDSIPFQAWQNLQERSSIEIAFDLTDPSHSIPAVGLEEPQFWISYPLGFVSGVSAFLAQFFFVRWLKSKIIR